MASPVGPLRSTGSAPQRCGEHSRTADAPRAARGSSVTRSVVRECPGVVAVAAAVTAARGAPRGAGRSVQGGSPPTRPPPTPGRSPRARRAARTPRSGRSAGVAGSVPRRRAMHVATASPGRRRRAPPRPRRRTGRPCPATAPSADRGSAGRPRSRPGQVRCPSPLSHGGPSSRPSSLIWTIWSSTADRCSSSPPQGDMDTPTVARKPDAATPPHFHPRWRTVVPGSRAGVAVSSPATGGSGRPCSGVEVMYPNGRGPYRRGVQRSSLVVGGAQAGGVSLGR